MEESHSSIYSCVSDLTRVSLEKGNRVRACLASYALTQLHRVDSGYNFPSIPSLGLPFLFFIQGLRKIFKRTKFLKIGRSRKASKTKKVALWLENYQYPEIDDEPFKRILRDEGFSVKDLELDWRDAFQSLKALMYLSFHLGREINNVADNIFEKTNYCARSKIIDSLRAKECRARLIDAFAISNVFVLRNTQLGNEETLVFTRHNGDVWPVLALNHNDGIRKSNSESFKIILLSHAGVPVNFPVSTVSEYVDQIWAKTEASVKVFRNRLDSRSCPIYLVGDPRVDKNIHDENDSCIYDLPLVSVALTETANERFFGKQSFSVISFLKKITYASGEEFKVQIKRRERLSRLEKMLSVFLRSGRYSLMKFVTDSSIVENVKKTSFAIVVANPKLRMISSVVLDYYQASVPTVILVPESFFKDKARWKSDISSFSVRVISVEEAELKIKKGEFFCFLKEVVSSDSVRSDSISSTLMFRNLVRNLSDRTSN